MSVEIYDLIKECSDISLRKIGHRSPTNKHMKALLSLLRSNLDEMVLIYEEVLPTPADIENVLRASQHMHVVTKRYKTKLSKARKEYLDGRNKSATDPQQAAETL